MAHLSRQLQLALAGALLAASASLSPACRVQPLEVGKEDVQQPEEASVVEAALPDTSLEAAATLESLLLAKCSAPPGVRDPYTSGLTLGARLFRRWFFCGTEKATPLPAGVGLAIDAQGNYALLRWNGARDAFVASTDPDERGKVRFFAYSDSGADGGRMSAFIALDDASPYTGIFVYLTRATMTDPSFLADFDTNPRRMILAQAGPTALSGTFVPID